LHSGLEKKAKLTTRCAAGIEIADGASPVGATGGPSSYRQIEDVYQSVERAGRIAPVPCPAAVAVPAYPRG
jgi:hypothetical protein